MSIAIIQVDTGIITGVDLSPKVSLTSIIGKLDGVIYGDLK